MKFSLIAAATLATLAVASPVEIDRRQDSGYFPPISEMLYCLNPFNTAACFAANGHAEVASAAAAANFPSSSLHNGQGDAFRHCYWNARMAIYLGTARAKEIGDNHENSGNNPANEKAMDLANNATGRTIGANAAGSTKEAKYNNAQAECLRRARNGQLVTLK
ncbi:secreted protein [Coprinopsis cinerea okayama7|uniref:Secreted protein n=1 Tax=Coprinopsis cinerea (strain Okayama-7 / 130 / ATCC MYA-4618 / FGSC 9003) TaxID=240176 RepID=A8NVK5_COPC7|nr:secreted protein [Coprinopsis cinerea okayama7\|eukprot:XP_001836671.2 secreted protein [Coprinopsis cinerea okayama7\